MNLPEDRRSPAREALEQMHLPHWLGAVEHRLEDRHRRAHERLVVGTIGQTVALHMIVQVEVRIVFERRVREVEGYECQLLPIAVQQVHPLCHVIDQLIVIDMPIEDVERSDVQRPRMRFAVNERSVLTGHAMGKLGWRGTRRSHFGLTPEI